MSMQMPTDIGLFLDIMLSRGYMPLSEAQKMEYESRKQGWRQEYARRLRIYAHLHNVLECDINLCPKKDKKHRPLFYHKSINFKVNTKRTVSISPCVDAWLEWQNMLASLQRDVNTAKVYVDMGKKGYVYLCEHIFGGGSVMTDCITESSNEIYDAIYEITTEMPWAIGIGFSINPILATGYVVCKARITQKWNIFYTCDDRINRFGASHPFNVINNAGGIPEECVLQIIEDLQVHLSSYNR